MEVDLARAPITAANFLKYVDGKFYDGGMINRAVRPDNTTRHDVEIEVIQFQIDPARRARAVSADSARAHERHRAEARRRRAVDGAQWSRLRDGVVLDLIGDQPELDFGGKRNADGQGFAVFGRVVAGMDVVAKIHAAKTLAPDAPQKGGYGTETLDPPIKILKAYRR